MKHFIRYTIEVDPGDTRDILIAELSDLGIEAFEEQDKQLMASGRVGDVLESAVEEIIGQHQLQHIKEEVADQNWNAVWESSFEPVLVDDFAAVRAGFHAPITHVQHELVITPKMSFGTGHHATTWLVMSLMRDLDFSGKTVFDFGTGTGVLAILAQKLGAKRVLAIDNDEWSIDNSLENVGNNDAQNVEVVLGTEPPANEQFDIILANINKHILLQNMAAIGAATCAEGLIVLSGLMENDEADIVGAAAEAGIQFLQKQAKNGWIALLFRKASA